VFAALADLAKLGHQRSTQPNQLHDCAFARDRVGSPCSRCEPAAWSEYVIAEFAGLWRIHCVSSGKLRQERLQFADDFYRKLRQLRSADAAKDSASG
jgi:hypothetical protein